MVFSLTIIITTTTTICTVLLTLPFIITVTSSYSLNITKNQLQQQQLLTVQIIYRHGDRTPYWIYKTDPYQEDEYPEGEGNLINRGRERMYRYGVMLRQRYRKYLEDMPTKNVQAYSSPIRRCMETSLAVLAGLFPPHQPWYDSLPLAKLWLPIAVETVEEARSWMLNPDAPCARAERIDRQMETSNDKLRNFLQENKQFIQVIGNLTGENYDSNHLRWIYVGYLFDTLFTEQIYFGNKWQRPEWLDRAGPNAWERLSTFNDMVFSIYETEQEFLKLRAGNFLNTLIENFRIVFKDDQQRPQQSLRINHNKNRKFFTYGSHDTMEAYILQALGLYKGNENKKWR